MFENDLFANKAIQHAQNTWHNVLSGHSSLSEKVEFGAEALLAAGATVALHKIGVSNLGLANLGKSAGKAGDVLSEFAISEAPVIRSIDAGEAFYAPHSPIIRNLDKNPAFETAAVDKHADKFVQTFDDLIHDPQWLAAKASQQYEEQAKLLNSHMGKFCDDVGLPFRGLGFDGNTTVGFCIPGTGRIAVDDTCLRSAGEFLTTTAGHELTHVEQDVLKIRRHADLLGIGSSASPEQLETLQSKFWLPYKYKVEDSFFSQVLEARAGQTLPVETANRADALIRWQHYGYRSQVNQVIMNRQLKVIDIARDKLKEGESTDAIGAYLTQFEQKSRAYAQVRRLGTQISEPGTPLTEGLLDQRTKSMKAKLEGIEARSYWMSLAERESRGTEKAISNEIRRVKTSREQGSA
jgi:hypothetical protein